MTHIIEIASSSSKITATKMPFAHLMFSVFIGKLPFYENNEISNPEPETEVNMLQCSSDNCSLECVYPQQLKK